MPKKSLSKIISETSETLSGLILQKKYAHMREPVQIVLGGLLLPILADLGELDTDDPNVSFFLEKYSRDNIKKILNPDPIQIPVEVPIEIIIKERPRFRRLREDVCKIKRKKRPLSPIARNTLIKWWNDNQKLVPSDDPICVILTERVNKLEKTQYPISNMQISGYFSLLCRMGLETEIDRMLFFRDKISKGYHTLMPKYTPELIELIKENWLRMKKEKADRVRDHNTIIKLRNIGRYKPIIADD